MKGKEDKKREKGNANNLVNLMSMHIVLKLNCSKFDVYMHVAIDV